MNKPVLSLKAVGRTPPDWVGGKAASCGSLLAAGLPVPCGFVVDPEMVRVDEGSRKLFREALDALPKDILLAVRSSATDEDGVGHSFAGLHESVLGVRPSEVGHAVQTCWESTRSARALAYRLRMDLPTNDVRTAVLVQHLIPARVSGVAFTSDPLTGSSDTLVINATWGLGEPLVSGQVEPDEFHLDRGTLDIIARRQGGKEVQATCVDGSIQLGPVDDEMRTRPSLSGIEVRRLGELLLQVEWSMGSPRDIEWCFDGETFWILQARPLTGSRRVAPPVEWTRANLAEILPDLPQPQVLRSTVQMLERSMRSYYGPLLENDGVLGPCVREFCGRPYLNLSQLRHLCEASGTPFSVVLEGLGHADRVEERDRRAPRRPWASLLRSLPGLLGLARRQLSVSRRAEMHFERMREHARALETSLASAGGALRDSAFLRVLAEWDDICLASLEAAYTIGDMLFWQMVLDRVCHRVGVDSGAFIHAVLVGGGKTVSSQQGFDLLGLAWRARKEPRVLEWLQERAETPLGSIESWRDELAGTAFLEALNHFLEVYGHRGPHESDWSLPRYSEDPSPLLFAIAHLAASPDLADPGAILSRQAAEASTAWASFHSRARARRCPWLVPLARLLVERVKTMYMHREQNRFEFVRVVAAWRKWHLLMAERFVARGWLEHAGDYFLLYLEEVREALEGEVGAGRLRAAVLRRRAEREAFADVTMPLLARSTEWPWGSPDSTPETASATALVEHDEQPPAETFTGVGLSPGTVEADVVVLRSPQEFARMRRGAILVAPATDPSWIPMFAMASGVIVEVGGTLSHAATVAREYGLPAVASVRGATRLLRNGDRVRMDGATGAVEVTARTARPA